MPMQSPAQMTFLIVDDVDAMRRSIRTMLKLINYGRLFLEAANGRDAWRIVEKGQPAIDFIISDYNMPYLTGTELLHRIRLNRKLRDIPFLMITAEANMEVVAEAAEVDVDAYMTKPFVTATLEQKITELLDQAAHPGQVTLLLRRAQELEEEGKLDEALAAVAKAGASSPTLSRPFREMGRLLLKKNDLPNSLAAFQKATELNRLDVTSYHGMGQIFFQMGRIDKAIDNYSRAMTISPRHAERALDFARLLLQQDKATEASRVMRLAFKINSNDPDMKERLTRFCADHGLHDLTIKASREILKQDPGRAKVLGYLGIALCKKGLFNEGVLTLEKAAAENEPDPELWIALAQAYLAMRMTGRAEKWAARAIRMAPDNEKARAIYDACL
ncbi:MAG: response regulator [Desulfobacterales bacterium CG2_30_60_27]|nr:MAG: response regulator [Desulfobacterales bacterium CG2_30_60_27]